MPSRQVVLHVLREKGARARFRLRDRLAKPMLLRDDGREYRYACASFDEYVRAESLFYKEPGTIRLVREELREGDVFYDIGANMGIYSVPAAVAVGKRGRVYAFEPHVANAESLLRNVSLNGLQDRVQVMSCALNDSPGFFDFKYEQLAPGTSMSQLGSDRDAFGRELRPEASELKFATTVDELVAGGAVEPADVVKIDVDGNELRILRGMRRLLEEPNRPRAVQVEVNVEGGRELVGYMEECGFECAERHYTEGFQGAVDSGADPSEIPYNGIFRPRP
jgi:FkbM family methyltransferase